MLHEHQHFDIRIDKHGVWYFRGEEMIRPDIVQYFYRYLTRDSAGKYLIEIDNDRCYVTVEDVPYVIKKVELCFSKDDGGLRIMIFLSDGSKEAVKLDTPFWVGEDNVMYCKVKCGEHTARFSRTAYYQRCKYIEYDSARDTYEVTFNNRSYPFVFYQSTVNGGSNVR